MTNIYTTKKLEKIIQKKVIIDSNILDDNFLGSWNATIFYIAKKKCLLFINSKSFYSVIIPKFSMKDIDKIDTLFLANLYEQLQYEKIAIDLNTIAFMIGNINLRPTNNNRKSIGILNYNIEKLNYFKYDYPVFNNLVIREMTEKLNICPFKQLNWKVPKEAMITLLNDTITKYNAQN